MRRRFAMVVGGAVLAALAGVVVMVSPGGTQTVTSTLNVAMVDGSGNPAGSVRLQFTSDGQTIVTSNVRLPAEFAGFRAFHVHQKAVCDPKAVDANGAPSPFFTSGGHFDSTASSHGHHDGDLPTLLVIRDGSTGYTVRTDRLNEKLLKDADGSALIVHAGKDNQGNIPSRYFTVAADGTQTPGPDAATKNTGDAGTRIACGIIK